MMTKRPRRDLFDTIDGLDFAYVSERSAQPLRGTPGTLYWWDRVLTVEEIRRIHREGPLAVPKGRRGV